MVSRWPRYSLVLLFALVLGAWLRFDGLGSLGLSHWDEGAFTSGALGVKRYGTLSTLFLYGPPLFPGLIRLAFDLLGTRSSVAIGISAFAGALTLPVFFFVARLFVPVREAITAVLLLAVCEYHLIYSRMALSDALFLLVFVVALGVILRTLRARSRSGAVLAGVATGVALLIKYHGFLALAVGALVHLLAPAGASSESRPWRSRLRDLSAAGPWVGLGLLPFLALLLLVILETTELRDFVEHRRRWMAPLDLAVMLGNLGAAARYLGYWVSPVVLAAALWGLLLALGRGGAARGAVIWFIGYAALVPFYKSFPRLLLPLVPPLLLLAASGLADLGLHLSRVVSRRLPQVAGVVFLAAIAAISSYELSRQSLAFRNTGYEQAARKLREYCEPQTRCLLLTQPCILFYMHDVPGTFWIYAHSDIPQALWHLQNGEFDLLVTDHRVLYNEPIRSYLREHAFELELLERLPNQLRDATLLNTLSFDRVALARTDASSAEAEACSTIRIFRGPGRRGTGSEPGKASR
ncbi:MAG: glycosyltransferase family 39 protein [Planctomycetota bacterium]